MLEDIKVPEGINKETLEHLMDPQNYGKMEHPSCVGVALDEKTKEYVIFYTRLDADIITDAKFATNGCQDTVVIGSMFTQMIINNSTQYANTAVEKIVEKLGKLSIQQQICADIVFSAFKASLINFEHIQNGAKEELHLLKMKESCEVVEDKEGESHE